MKKTKKAIALVLAGALMSGCFVGCDLITRDPERDLAQVVATVDITRSSEFAEGEMYAAYKDVVSETQILKRDMLAYYQDYGYIYRSSYGMSYADTFRRICNDLIIRQLDVQYAMIYFLRDEDVKDEKDNRYTIEGFNAAVEAGKKNGDELAELSYFLTPDEEARALYAARRLFNNTLDANEPQYIQSKDDNSSSTEEQRTLPTGVETTNSDYFDKGYKVYTGKNKPDECGSYEALEGSTATSRKLAYNDLLEQLRSNNLLSDGENTNDIEKLAYFEYERKSSYESAIISKLAKEFEKKAESEIKLDSIEKTYDNIYKSQTAAFEADKSSFESKLDSISNDTFLLTAPEANYGYVINILLPFSALQSAQVSNLKPDAGDTSGNSFKQRASILEKLTATDQRSSWFSGEKDYAYEGSGYTGGDADRKYLFFEKSLNTEDENPKYEPMKNYYGKYTYNGYVYKNEHGTYELAPNKINIDGFIKEMEDYLAFAGLTTSVVVAKRNDYYTQTKYYNPDKKVEYSNFVYYAGKVEFGKTFDANNMFVSGEPENKAFSVINELSFAYNTDTAGLNPYLGYSIVTGKTSFVNEFEYASQKACEGGAGTYYIVPSDYGWHIIYCTFSFVEAYGSPFVYTDADKDKEGTFSYYFYESMKADKVSEYSSNRSNMITNAYSSCKTVYEKAYNDLLNLDS